MKLLVAIANYGTKNNAYARQLIDEYRSMPYETDIVVLSEAPKDYGEGVTVLVGLPSSDPWSLPFAHKRLFADRVEDYDLFVYSEDDTLIREENLRAFLRASQALGEGLLPGFIRYELYPDGSRNFTDIHGPYHWLPGTVRRAGGYTYAQLSNLHSACYVLTQEQLRRAIGSGGFLVEPHSGRYDLICSAGTDPYTRCGFRRVICLSHLPEFELHHLSNAYLNRVGLDEEEYLLQVEALYEVLRNERLSAELLAAEKPLATPAWDKLYYEPCRKDLVRMVSPEARNILSVGCGWGKTEEQLVAQGKRVTAIPLDAVIGRLAEARGVDVLPPDFAEAFRRLEGKTFDAILLSDVLQHLPDPVELLDRLKPLLAANGVLVGSVPNLGLIRRAVGRWRAKSNRWTELKGGYTGTSLHMTTAGGLKAWFEAAGLKARGLAYGDFAPAPWLAEISPGVAASTIFFTAKRGAR